MPQGIDALKQFRLAIIAMAALVVLGTFGYHILQGWPLLDCLYMTVITLATVGYKEVAPLDATGKAFTIVLIVFGVSTVFWAGASLIEVVVGEQIWHALQRKRMEKTISKLKDHYIICGYGRMGQQIVKDLQHEGVGHVVIERNPEQIPRLIARDIPFIEGDASDNLALKAAGVENAKGLITVAPSDEDNVFITLSAKALNPNLFIVARSIMEDNESKLRMAGANKVMSPYVMGGRRMATAVLRPNVLDFFDLAMRTDDVRIMMEEVNVLPGSKLLGKTIAESDIKKETGAIVVAIRKASGKMVANPPDDEIIEEGDVLIVLGVGEQLDKVEGAVCPGG